MKIKKNIFQTADCRDHNEQYNDQANWLWLPWYSRSRYYPDQKEFPADCQFSRHEWTAAHDDGKIFHNDQFNISRIK